MKNAADHECGRPGCHSSQSLDGQFDLRRRLKQHDRKTLDADGSRPGFAWDAPTSASDLRDLQAPAIVDEAAKADHDLNAEESTAVRTAAGGAAAAARAADNNALAVAAAFDRQSRETDDEWGTEEASQSHPWIRGQVLASAAEILASAAGTGNDVSIGQLEKVLGKRPGVPYPGLVYSRASRWLWQVYFYNELAPADEGVYVAPSASAPAPPPTSCL